MCTWKAFHDVNFTFQRCIESPGLRDVCESDKLMLPGALSTADNRQAVCLCGCVSSPEHRALSGCLLGSPPHPGLRVNPGSSVGVLVACWAGVPGPGPVWGEDPGCLPPTEPIWSASPERSDKLDFPTAVVGLVFSLPVEMETESARKVRWAGGWVGLGTP